MMTATLETSPRAALNSMPIDRAPVGAQLLGSTNGRTTTREQSSDREHTSDRGQDAPDTQRELAPVGATPTDFPGGQSTLDAHQSSAPGDTNSTTDGALLRAAPNRGAPRPSLFDPTLYTLAQYLADVEGLRKAQGNRLRILTATEPDEDGVMRGFGYDETHPVVATIGKQLEQLEQIEHQAVLELQRVMRKHPLAAWGKSAKGVGEKQLARLLAAVGDPYMRGDNGQPRTVSQLWAYCGLHTLPNTSDDGGQRLPDTQHPSATVVGTNIAAKRRKGVQANWSTDAKTRAYLIATSCIKQTSSEYRAVYDARRLHTATTHEDWTPGHSHNDALRIVSKRILRDLWRAARDYYEGETAP